MSRPLLSVVIPTMDRPEMLIRAMASVWASLGSGYPHELIIVDSSRPPVWVEFGPGAGQVVYQLGRFTGAGIPINTGCRVAVGKYVAILNDDCIVEGTPLSEAVAIMEKDSAVGQVAIPWWSDASSDQPRVSVIGSKDVPYANFGVTRRILGDQYGWWKDYTHFYGDPALTCHILDGGFRMETAKHGSVKHFEAPSYFRGLEDQWKSSINSTDDHVKFMSEWGHLVDTP